jgi:hypothetical protein
MGSAPSMLSSFCSALSMKSEFMHAGEGHILKKQIAKHLEVSNACVFKFGGLRGMRPWYSFLAMCRHGMMLGSHSPL